MPLDQIGEESEAEMTFLDHLEELRWHLIRSLIAIMVFAVGAFAAKTLVFHTIILGPSRIDFWTYEMLCQLSALLSTPALCIDELPFIIQSRQMTGQFSMHVTSSFVIGIICAFPYAFWEIWRFIKPGLYPREQRAARGATFYVSFLFIVGVLFGYFIVTPISINFLSNYQLDPTILNEFDIVSYVSTVITLILACGILFQLPIVVYFLTKAGLVTPELMKKYRKHAIVAILVLGAMLTPPDPFSQILIALPLFGLYQVSIFISKRVISKDMQSSELTTP
ncbi:MAG: twin-arginine translocase subunit TatC [Cyclobacteriaceae bacterium]